MMPIIIFIVINPLLVVILRFDDAKPSHHYDALERHQIVIFIKVVEYNPYNICAS